MGDNMDTTTTTTTQPKIEKPTTLSDFLSSIGYKLGEALGKGSYAQVVRCIRIADNSERALKIIDLRPIRLRQGKRFKEEKFLREVKILKRLCHKNIVKLYEVHKYGDTLLLFLELAKGRELFDAIVSRQRYMESDARVVFKQLLCGVKHLHDLGIIHRDLKPENVLLVETEGKSPVVKLIDFGLSKMVGGGSLGRSMVGTPEYCAPEIHLGNNKLSNILGAGSPVEQNEYGFAVDCWSMGIILFVMLSGTFPTFEKDQPEDKPEISFPGRIWLEISTSARDLIRSLLQIDPSNRISVQGALNHPWITGNFESGGGDVVMITDSSKSTKKSTKRLRGENVDADPKEDDVEPLVVNIQNNCSLQDKTSIKIQPEQKSLLSGLNINALEILDSQIAIAKSFEMTYKHFKNMPCVAKVIRCHAVKSREHMMKSSKVLQTLNQTARNILGTLPDLNLAVEEKEPGLSANFFKITSKWIQQVKKDAMEALSNNNKIIMNTHTWIEGAKCLIARAEKNAKKIKSDAEAVAEANAAGLITEGTSKTSSMSTTSMDSATSADSSATNVTPPNRGRSTMSASSSSPSIKEVEPMPEVRNVVDRLNVDSPNPDDCIDVLFPKVNLPEASTPKPIQVEAYAPVKKSDVNVDPCTELVRKGWSPCNLESAGVHIAPAEWVQILDNLYRIEKTLQQFATFWANMEILVNIMVQKSEHVQTLIAYTNNPKIKERYYERMDEYRSIWGGIGYMCDKYARAVAEAGPNAYAFLEGDVDLSKFTQPPTGGHASRGPTIRVL